MQRFVIFDLFHTLVHGADDERDQVVAQMAGLVGVEPAGLVQIYNATWRQRLIQWSAEETVRILAERLGGRPSAAQITRAGALRREHASHVLASVAPTTISVLDRLRAAGWRLGLVSNATAETAEAWPGCSLAERFEVAVFSSELAVAKPDPRIYLAATDELNAVPAQCFYVGDGADGELGGAAALGMRVVRTTEHNDTDPSWPGTPIRSLTELPGLLNTHVTAHGGEPN